MFDINEYTKQQIEIANEKLKNVKSAQELCDLVDDYLFDTTGLNLGFPLYLVGKRSGWQLYSGTVTKNDVVVFLVSDGVSYRWVHCKNAHKYYKFASTCR